MTELKTMAAKKLSALVLLPEATWPNKLDAFLSPFRRCVGCAATVVQKGGPMLQYALNGHAWRCISLCAVDFIRFSLTTHPKLVYHRYS